MRIFFTISILLIFFVNCQKAIKERKSTDKNKTQNFVHKFENELNELPNQDASLIDDATLLFQKYIKNTSNEKRRDSLFLPYFNVYMSGRKFLKNEDKRVFEKYGFIKKNINGKEYLKPTKSKYLQINIIGHLSETMQEFCNQQLKEFNDIENLETTANNALWWERFNKENPDFFLKDMTTYHYKNWHLKNLLAGTKNVPVFKEGDLISKNALEVYNKIIRDNPETETANTLRVYIDSLNKVS